MQKPKSFRFLLFALAVNAVLIIVSILKLLENNNAF